MHACSRRKDKWEGLRDLLERGRETWRVREGFRESQKRLCYDLGEVIRQHLLPGVVALKLVPPGD